MSWSVEEDWLLVQIELVHALNVPKDYVDVFFAQQVSEGDLRSATNSVEEFVGVFLQNGRIRYQGGSQP